MKVFGLFSVALANTDRLEKLKVVKKTATSIFTVIS